MKKALAVLLFMLLAAGGLVSAGRYRSFEPAAKAATGAIFIVDKDSRIFECSGTEIGKTTDGYGIFLTARHCAADPDTNEVHERLQVSFSDNEGGPFYDATPIAISLTDDLAILLIRNGADIPEARIRDEHNLRSGDSIFNTSYPLGAGKTVFHGEFLASRFPFFPSAVLAQYPMWKNSMPINLTIAHGSSGSGVFSNRDQALIGVAVGTFDEGSYNIAIPADRVLYFLAHLQDNTVDKFEKAFPVQDAPNGWF